MKARRPQLVNHWIQSCSRAYDGPRSLKKGKKLQVFAKQWVIWWAYIRTMGVDGKAFFVHGLRGILEVALTLTWWKPAEVDIYTLWTTCLIDIVRALSVELS